MWASEPLPPYSPFSMSFLALSHAPPAFAIKIARSTPVTVAPASIPPSALGPRINPTATGDDIAKTPGSIISLNAAVVLMSMHRTTSGFTPGTPSRSPGISLNWRLISCTILKAALPTLVMVREPMKNGIAPPSRRPITTRGSASEMSKDAPSFTLIVCEKAEKSASAVNAAEPMAKPLPMAAVVLPRESRLSVISLTSGPRPLISDIPPALSAIGP